jgi:predicted DNA-binding ribbon-helix-helix protein
MSKKPLNVSIEAELIDFLKQMAAERNVSVSAWLSRLLSDWRDSGVEPVSDAARKRMR